jgi:hypothetical protein
VVASGVEQKGAQVRCMAGIWAKSARRCTMNVNGCLGEVELRRVQLYVQYDKQGYSALRVVAEWPLGWGWEGQTRASGVWFSAAAKTDNRGATRHSRERSQLDHA